MKCLLRYLIRNSKSKETIMEDKIFLVTERPIMRKGIGSFRKFGAALSIILMAVFIAGCSKEGPVDPSAANPLADASISATIPADLADTVVINPVVAVTFKSAVTPADVSASTITLMEGTTSVQGKVSVSGNTATFTPIADLKPDTRYVATVKTSLKSGSVDGKSDQREHSWSFRTGKHRRANAPVVVSVLPLNSATSVAIAVQPTVTFSEEMTESTIKSTSITFTQGTTNIEGSVTYSGKIATFKPVSSLIADKVYTGTVTFGANHDGDDDNDEEGDDDSDDHKMAGSFTWSFTTGVGGIDVIAPTISSVLPANNATAIAITSKPAVTFSEAMSAATITSATFTLKQGTTVVAGTVAYSGTTATFTPTSSLVAGLVYTGTITTGAKDVAGNAIAANYTWSFTTAVAVVVDVTPPTIQTIVPASGATSIALNSKVTAAFSEAMTASTITSTTFTVKQGTTSISGTVAYSGTTATFTPSSAFVAGTVYTASVTGVKDAAGNAIAADKTWSFTTLAAAPAATSWSTQVWPIIQSKCTVCHSAAGGSGGINMGSYAQVSALSNTQIDYAGIYSSLLNAASKANVLGEKSIFFTHSHDSEAPISRSIPLSSHSTESGPMY